MFYTMFPFLSPHQKPPNLNVSDWIRRLSIVLEDTLSLKHLQFVYILPSKRVVVCLFRIYFDLVTSSNLFAFPLSTSISPTILPSAFTSLSFLLTFYLFLFFYLSPVFFRPSASFLGLYTSPPQSACLAPMESVDVFAIFDSLRQCTN